MGRIELLYRSCSIREALPRDNYQLTTVIEIEAAALRTAHTIYAVCNCQEATQLLQNMTQIREGALLFAQPLDTCNNVSYLGIYVPIGIWMGYRSLHPTSAGVQPTCG